MVSRLASIRFPTTYSKWSYINIPYLLSTTVQGSPSPTDRDWEMDGSTFFRYFNDFTSLIFNTKKYLCISCFQYCVELSATFLS